LGITNAGGCPNTGTLIISSGLFYINYEHITVENQLVSKFWADPRKPGRPLKGTGKSRKTAKEVLSKKSQ